jgi:hypothetical protein
MSGAFRQRSPSWQDGLKSQSCQDGPPLCRNPLKSYGPNQLSWKCCRFRCRPQLVLTTWCRVFPTRRPDTADVLATSCDVGSFFSVSYVVSLPNCRHVVVVCRLITINHSTYPEKISRTPEHIIISANTTAHHV